MTTPAANELPKNFQPKEAEERWRALWERGGFFRADNSRANDESYTIVIPPPNVTGALHLGHGLVQTIQDVLIRHHRMAGRNALWVPGTDHAGIATQHVVVEKLRQEGRTRQELGREKFLEEVWRWKEEYHGRITSQIKLLGCSCDWSREAFTMDEERARAVRVAFSRLYNQGLIYRGLYMVNWDPVSLTALADDEVEYEDEEGQLWHIKYPFADGSGRFAVVATTRPETMLGDTAVAVNPQDERYRDVVGMEVELPLTGRRIPIIADDFVRAEFGSGMVKITPAHDPNDFAAAQRQNLPVIDIFTDDAKTNDKVPESYRHLDRYTARERVVADLKGLGLLEKIEKHPHRVGRGYRSKAVVEPRLTEQWFVRWGKLRDQAVGAVRSGEIRILPKAQENTFFSWMENLRDWCISRQLWWGHRIPIWYRKSNPGEMLVCDDEGNTPAAVVAAPGEWRQDEDVLDTWFSSALWPFSVLGWPDKTLDMKAFFPTSVLVTGHDILFFWVARMMMMSYGLVGGRPFKDVFLHGLIFGKSYYRRRGGDLELISPKERRELRLDELEKLPPGVDYKWEKMSKSKGNVIDPIEMFDVYGVDAVRAALLAYSGQGRTIEIDRQRIEGYRNFINKLWNASRFVLTATQDVSAEQFTEGVDGRELAREDRWILTRLGETVEGATRALESYEFDVYTQVIYQFLWNDYCDWYLELVKGRVYRTADGTTEEQSGTAKVVLLTVLECLQRLLHPAIPYATEEIWQLMKVRLGRSDRGLFTVPSLAIAAWPKVEGARDAKAVSEIEFLKSVIGAIRNIRGEMSVPMDMSVEVLVELPDAARREVLQSATAQIRALSNVKSLSIAATQAAAPFASTHVSGDLSIQVILPAELRAAEKGRIEKELAHLEKGYNATKAKLSNEKFVGSAPAEVVAKEREKLAKYEGDMEALRVKHKAL
ncbi:valine--tRNA ligase [Candidatus Sumerlaeota bacterium]|nr:valine--tRNA ligase [Candidatus Sumerlaeota bacterium]